MKAIVWTKYGGPEGLELAGVQAPIPKDGEVRVRINAATVTAGDCEVRSLTFRFPLAVIMRAYVGFVKPKRIRILGQEFAGEVDAVGQNVTNFSVGDRVFPTDRFHSRCDRLSRPVQVAPRACHSAGESSSSANAAACLPISFMSTCSLSECACVSFPGPNVITSMPGCA